MQSPFIHSVYFWLKTGINPDERLLFYQTALTLTSTPGLTMGQLSVPAPTRRAIIDSSFDFHLLLIFTDEAAHDAYQQTDENHQLFIRRCSPLWQKIVIYDSMATPRPSLS